MKKWLLIGGGLVLTIAAILGLRKEEDKHDEKIRKMISDVDMKPKEEVKTVEELSNDVDDAMSGMDVGEEENAENEDLEKWKAEREEYMKTTWSTDVEAAVKAKNYSKLEDLLDMKYAGGPWHPSPASVYASAKVDGMIDDATLNGARKYFGRLWNYRGD